MQCSVCQFVGSDTANFCEECGAPLKRRCPACDQKVRPSAKFCPECGTRLGTATDRQADADRATEALEQASEYREVSNSEEAQRRQLTVMFCDLVGSTGLSAALDPEDLRELIRAYQQTCAEVIYHFGGYIAQYLGDGLLVYFGFPQTHEDCPYRAVRAGLKILEALESLNNDRTASQDQQLAVRIGAHTGLVVIGAMGGAGRYEQLALGETPNIAARLQGLAEPDTLVISAATEELVRKHFRCKSLGSHTLKGVETPMPIYHVVEERAPRHHRHPGNTRRVAAPNLVGRDDQQAELLDLWAEVQRSRGQAVLLCGEAGIGKSSLARWVQHRLMVGETYRGLEFHCSSYFRQSAFYPVVDHLRSQLGLSPADASEEKLEKLERMLEARDGSGRKALPYFANLLSVKGSMSRYRVLDKLDPQDLRDQTQAAIVEWLLEQAQGQPALMVWEDLHWIDPTTLELLSLLIERLSTTRILLILTFRPEFVHPWKDHGSVREIELQRLNPEQIETLVGEVSQHKKLPPAVVQQLVNRTDGVPLFVEELTKILLQSDSLKEESDRYELIGSMRSLTIPATLQDWLMARLDRLATVRTIIQVAAVLGRQFSYRMLLTVSPVKEETLRNDLGRLVAAELVFQQGEPPESLYVFKHALIQEAAYKSLLRSRRQEIHRQVAEVLEDPPSELAPHQLEGEQTGVLPLLAFHWSRAVDAQNPEPTVVAKAIDYLLRAGEQELGLSAYQEAFGHLDEALNHIEHRPPGVDRDQQELLLQVRLSTVLKVVRGWTSPEVKRAYDRARELCLRLDRRQELSQVLFGLWSFNLFHGKYEQALTSAEECFQVARESDDSDLLMEAHTALANSQFWLSELPDSLFNAERVRALYDPRQHAAHRTTYGQDPRILAGMFSVWSLWQMGSTDDALARNDELLNLARELSHPFSLAIALNTSTCMHRNRRDPQATRIASRELIDLSRKAGFPNYEIVGLICRDWARAEAGSAEEVLADSLANYRRFPQLMGGVALAYCGCLVAEVCLQVGNLVQARSLLETSLTHIDSNRELAYEAELLCLRGDIELQLSAQESGASSAARRHRDAAGEAFRKAFELACQRHQTQYAELAGKRLIHLLEADGDLEAARAIRLDSERAQAATRALVQRVLFCGSRADSTAGRFKPSSLDEVSTMARPAGARRLVEEK